MLYITILIIQPGFSTLVEYTGPSHLEELLTFLTVYTRL